MSQRETMTKSTIYRKHELEDGYLFDPQAYFSKFLEEARSHSSEPDFIVPSPQLEEAENGGLGEERKCKKSWRKTLFSWLKPHKKGEHQEANQAPRTSHVSKRKQALFSGPIHGGCDRKVNRTQRRSTSGPITGLFTSGKRADQDIPYMCLDQLKDPQCVHDSYGPVYLVT